MHYVKGILYKSGKPEDWHRQIPVLESFSSSQVYANFATSSEGEFAHLMVTHRDLQLH